MFFDLVTWPPFCRITCVNKKEAKCKVKENCKTNLKSTLCYAALLSYRMFRWHLLNIRLLLGIHLVTYSKFCSYLCTLTELDIKFLVAYSYVASYSQITATSDRPHLFKHPRCFV